MSPANAPRVCVLCPTPQLTVTVEAGPGGDQIHVHPGGQGIWMARMARTLGADVVLCGPFGGEAGKVAGFLASGSGLVVRATSPGDAYGNGAYVHDRRTDRRTEIARMDPAPLDRHQLDDLFGAVLVEALEADVVLLAGPEPAETVPAAWYGRLAQDLRSTGRTVVADVSGETMQAVADHGASVLKISHSELADSGLAGGTSRGELLDAAQGLLEREVEAVVVSRADDPTLLVTPRAVHELVAPEVTIVEHRGAGDSMTAAIAVGLARGMALEDAVRLGVAAGALNVTRHGLGSGERDQIERFSTEVVAREVARG